MTEARRGFEEFVDEEALRDNRLPQLCVLGDEPELARGTEKMSLRHLGKCLATIPLFWLCTGIAVFDFSLLLFFVLNYGVKPSAFGLLAGGIIAVAIAVLWRRSAV